MDQKKGGKLNFESVTLFHGRTVWQPNYVQLHQGIQKVREVKKRKVKKVRYY